MPISSFAQGALSKVAPLVSVNQNMNRDLVNRITFDHANEVRRNAFVVERGDEEEGHSIWVRQGKMAAGGRQRKPSSLNGVCPSKASKSCQRDKDCSMTD